MPRETETKVERTKSAPTVPAAAVTVLLSLIFAGSFLATPAAAAVHPKSTSPLEDQLKSQYTLIQMTATGPIASNSATILTVQKDGIVGVPPNNLPICAANFREGSLRPPSLIGKACLTAIRSVARSLSTGEKVYAFKIDVDAKSDKVTLHIVECDSCNQVTSPSSLKSEVTFEFPKGHLATGTVDDLTNSINQVLSIDRPSSGDSNHAQDAPNTTSPPPSGAPQPVAPAQSIQIGQTLDQVQAIAGDQLTMITALKDTQVYKYQGQIIVFTDGKVSEIR
jgi:hypothetical protein